MNDLVDSNAKDYLTVHCRGRRPKPLYFSNLFHEPWTLYLQGIKQPSLNREHCYENLFGPMIHRYWHNHHDIPIPSCKMIDWFPSYLATRRLPLGLQRWRWKFSTGCIGVGNQLFHRRYQSHSVCPLCGATNEKVSHVLRCPDPQATSFAVDRIKQVIRPVLQEHETDPVLSSALLDILSGWRHGHQLVLFKYDTSV